LWRNGRRGRLKICYLQECGGSSPSRGTTKMELTLKRKWELATINPELIYALQDKFKLSYITAHALAKKASFEDAEKFLDPNLKSEWIDPAKLKNLDTAVDVLLQEMKKGQKIGIIGDYDVDGITSTIILQETLKKLNLESVYSVPNRIQGYGPNHEAFEYFQKENVNLIFMLDCGTNSNDFCQKWPGKIIIIDHHACDNFTPNATIVNPNIHHENFISDEKFQKMCAAQLTFLFVHALLNKLNHPEKTEILKSKLDLVSMAIVCDVMPLNNLNRAFVKIGMKEIELQKRIGIKHLIQESKLRFPLTAEDIGFSLGPKINAAGRMLSCEYAIKLLSTNNEEEAFKLTLELGKINELRKNLQEEILKQAREQAILQKDEKILVLFNERWNVGIIGIIAGMICEEFHKPAIVASRIENEIKASCRSRSINIGYLVQQAAAQKLILKGGGHFNAAGLSCDPQKWDEFKIWLSQSVQNEIVQAPVLQITCVASMELISEDFKKLGPFGNGNEKIAVWVKDLIIRNFAEYPKCYRLTLEENFSSHTFFIFKKQTALIEFFKNSQQLRKKIDIVINLSEKNFHSIEDAI
jgi:single-stranded-DNA-specific exonuclease